MNLFLWFEFVWDKRDYTEWNRAWLKIAEEAKEVTTKTIYREKKRTKRVQKRTTKYKKVHWKNERIGLGCTEILTAYNLWSTERKQKEPNQEKLNNF